MSVDPLSFEFPWNSTYAFAENDVIRCIDLDGKEKITTIIFSEPETSKPGIAIMTIEKTFYAVTSGLGAMNKSDINSDEFQRLAAKGNTTLYLKKLASETSQAEEASPSDIASGNCYQVAVFYNYKIIAEDNVTVNDAMKKTHGDKAKNGILLDQVDDNEIDQIVQGFVKSGITPEINSETDDYYRFGYIARMLNSAIVKGASKGARAAGSNESLNGVPYNVIMFAKDYKNIKTSTDLSLIEDVLHESGHNDAESNWHTDLGTGAYEYNQTGTQSNNTGDVKHSKTNTLKLINDTSNRKNSSTIKFDNSKLNPETK